jgi:tetrahydromethanopterin S-methyltransferase subunit G
LILFTSCSANWHLKKAIVKDPSIIDTKADTSIQSDINYRDSLLFWQSKTDFSFESDIKDTNRIEILQKDTVIKQNDDMDLLTWVQNGNVFTESRYRKDTTIIHRDTTRVAIPYFTEVRTVTKQNEAVITQVKSFWGKMEQAGRIIVIITGVLIGLALLYLIFRIFKKLFF